MLAYMALMFVVDIGSNNHDFVVDNMLSNKTISAYISILEKNVRH